MRMDLVTWDTLIYSSYSMGKWTQFHSSPVLIEHLVCYSLQELRDSLKKSAVDMLLIMKHCSICVAEYWYEIILCISVLCYLHCKPESHCHLHYKQWKYMYIFLYSCGYWPFLLNISKLINCIWIWGHFKQKNPPIISNKPALFGIKLNRFILYLLKAAVI